MRDELRRAAYFGAGAAATWLLLRALTRGDEDPIVHRGVARADGAPAPTLDGESGKKNSSLSTESLKLVRAQLEAVPADALPDFVSHYLRLSKATLLRLAAESMTGGELLEHAEPDRFGFDVFSKLRWSGVEGADNETLGRWLKALVAVTPAASAEAETPMDDDADDASPQNEPGRRVALLERHLKVLREAAAATAERRQASAQVVETDNGFGVMLSQPSSTMQRWMRAAAAADTQGPHLDIGAAYGVASAPVLAAGARVVACDLSSTQLDLIAERASALLRDAPASDAVVLVPEVEQRLECLVGAVPGVLSRLSPPVHHVLASNVLHFLPPRALRLTLQRLYDAMAPGACLYVEADTPYMAGTWPLSWLYAWRRVLGSAFPGYFWFPASLRAWLLPHRLRAVDHYHMLDTRVLLRELRAVGFEIDELFYESLAPEQDAFGLVHDGREIVVAIACRR
ncbi:uncharacterized protein MONBRDRAFT_39313 [Monosiga brevicollis MX1]|uniref:Methyltransferase type 12 domain-containing protein n=1 Tax=Monosiga brevicollis TaxID=81824 RepID=A9VDP2_MONBE|nr:uncharacterized protein MONBRDRAFT_39313 [Monosiga brevicollis MX1]EDQ84336.1 predicted protein [Monosiga brevicollis MX1]|eukprot:XP_001750832.1 hypothetical protein [Monosiga brevicollis MX1]